MERAVWKEEAQRHCEEDYDDREETADKQMGRIRQVKAEGDRQFTGDGRLAEITTDLVLGARGKMAEEKVNGPVDTDLIKELPQENIFEITESFQSRLGANMTGNEVNGPEDSIVSDVIKQ